MGQATSRTRPSMVACEAFARSPAMEVFCGERDAARSESIPQAASRQRLQYRVIGSPFLCSLFSLFIIYGALHTLGRASSRCDLECWLVNWRKIAIALIMASRWHLSDVAGYNSFDTSLFAREQRQHSILMM